MSFTFPWALYMPLVLEWHRFWKPLHKVGKSGCNQKPFTCKHFWYLPKKIPEEPKKISKSPVPYQCILMHYSYYLLSQGIPKTTPNSEHRFPCKSHWLQEAHQTLKFTGPIMNWWSETQWSEIQDLLIFSTSLKRWHHCKLKLVFVLHIQPSLILFHSQCVCAVLKRSREPRDSCLPSMHFSPAPPTSILSTWWFIISDSPKNWLIWTLAPLTSTILS